MRHIARTDANQAKLVAALRAVGARVLCIHQLGGGAPDLVVGFRGLLHLIEVKDGSKPPSARKLTALELAFHREWRGYVHVAASVNEALKIIGAVA